jgi:hypothetical protein
MILLDQQPYCLECGGHLLIGNIHLRPVWNEWEIILEELTRMGYIVKKESESDGGE